MSNICYEPISLLSYNLNKIEINNIKDNII